MSKGRAVVVIDNAREQIACLLTVIWRPCRHPCAGDRQLLQGLRGQLLHNRELYKLAAKWRNILLSRQTLLSWESLDPRNLTSGGAIRFSIYLLYRELT